MSICPKCGGTLKHGLLRSPSQVFWTEGEDQGLYVPVRRYGDVVLPDSSHLMGTNCPADYCEACQLLLLSTKEDEYP